MRWYDVAKAALQQQGYVEVAHDDSGDYQGWVCILSQRADIAKSPHCQKAIDHILAHPSDDAARDWFVALAAESGTVIGGLPMLTFSDFKKYVETRWAVLKWDYGSCSGCDPYEDMEDGERLMSFVNDIECVATEAEARQLFETRKGW